MWDPSITQKVAVSVKGDTDRSRVLDMIMSAVCNNDEGLKELAKALRVLELEWIGRVTEARVKELIAMNDLLHKDVLRKNFFWKVVVPILGFLGTTGSGLIVHAMHKAHVL
jgi:hypothetical protein